MKKYYKNFKPNAVAKQYQATEADVKLKRKYNKSSLLTKYNLTLAQISEMFGYSSPNSFYNAHCREDIVNGVEEVIQHIENQVIVKESKIA